MRALVVTPKEKGSGRVIDVPEEDRPGDVAFRTLAVGICGTDVEISQGIYGEAPPGSDYLILGHEALGVVETVPAGAQLKPGDLVVPVVRRPCGQCHPCAVGQWDMCLTGNYTERGIKGRHGFLSERVREREAFLVKLPPGLEKTGVLVEPTSVVAKAVRQVELAQNRLPWEPRRAAVMGAGPIGLLATLLLTQKGLQVAVMDLAAPDSKKAQAVRALGAEFIPSPKTAHDRQEIGEFDLIVEATGFSPLLFEAVGHLRRNGCLVLTGVTGGHHRVTVDSDVLNQSLVLENHLILGSVNASMQDYRTAVAALSRAESDHPGWAASLITRRVPLRDFQSGFLRQEDDIKVVVDLDLD